MDNAHNSKNNNTSRPFPVKENSRNYIKNINDVIFLPREIKGALAEDEKIYKHIERDRDLLMNSLSYRNLEGRRELLRAFGLFSFPTYDDLLFKYSKGRKMDGIEAVFSDFIQLKERGRKRIYERRHPVIDLLDAEEKRLCLSYVQKMNDQKTVAITTQRAKRLRVRGGRRAPTVARMNIIKSETMSYYDEENMILYLPNRLL